MKSRYAFVLLTFSMLQLSAQKASLFSTHYHYANKLEQEIIRESFEDQDGFIWMINNSGITRFDGQEFKFFGYSGDRYIRYFSYFQYPGSDSLYILSYPGKGIFRLKNGQIEEATDLVPDYKKMIQFKNHFIYSQKTVAENKTAALKKRNKWFEESGRPDLPEEFITNTKQIYSLDLISGTIHYFSEGVDQVLTLPGLQLFNNFLVNDTLTIFTKKRSLVQIYKGNKITDINLKKYGNPLKSIQNLDTQKSIFADKQQLYLADSGSCYKLVISNNSVVLEPLNIPDKLSAVSSIIYDNKTGQYFITSAKDGAYLIKGSPFTNIYRQNIDFPLNAEVTVLPVGNDSLLLSSGYLYSGGKFTKVLPSMLSFILCKDNTGNIYFSLKEQGLWRTDNRFRKPTKIYCNKNGSFVGFTMSDSKKMYACSSTDIYQVKNDSLVLISNIFKQRTNGEEILTIQMKNENEMLIGTQSGLLLLIINTGKISTILNKSLVRTLRIDSLQNTWVGTYGNGYYLLDKNNNLTTLPLDNEKNLRFVHCFVPDKKGNIWMSTNNGLFKAKMAGIYHYQQNPKENFIKYSRFTKLDGIINNEFNGSGTYSAVSDSTGTMFFSNMAGIIKMIPAIISQPRANDKIFIESILLDRQPLAITDSINLPNNYKTLDFSVISTRFAEAGTLEYAIDSTASLWQTINNQTIQLNKLSAGGHVLLLRKDIDGEGSNFVYKKIYLLVAPKFYESRYFISLLAALLFFVLFIVYYITRLRQMHIQRKLEGIVEVKTNMLNKKIIELSENYITLNKITGIVVHDLRSPITFIKQYISKLITARKNLSENEITDQLTTLHNSIEKMSVHINNMLPWLISSLKNEQLPDNNTDINKVLEDAVAYYHTIIIENGNQLITNISKDLYGNIEANTLSIIIRNIIDNANKYTNNGKINLDAAEAPGNKVMIRVTDNGSGFDVEKTMSEVAHYATSSLHSMGLKIITDIILKGNMEYTLQSEPGKGTTFTIWIAMAISPLIRRPAIS